MSVLLALEKFSATVTRNFSTHVDAQPEDQLKAPAITLLEAVGDALLGKNKEVTIRTEARSADVHGRPDLGVAIKKLLAGFIELKAPGLGSNPNRLKGEQNKKQWENFKAIPNLIYTDGNQWSLYRSGEQVGETVSFKGDITTGGAKAVSEKNADAFENLLLDFLNWEPIIPHSPKELAHYLAPLAKFLRSEVELAVEDKNSNLSLLAHEWRDYLFPHADNHQFADAYAQTLTYALLLAKISGASDLAPETAAKVLDKGNGLLATTLRILAQGGAREEVSVGYDLLERSLSALVPSEILKRSPNLWLYFYEDFLAAYDRKLRNDYGVYYTPVEVVKCQVNLVSQLLDERFGKRLSFADDGVTFIDPAVGTGTYLVTAIQHALGQVRERSGEGAAAARASLIVKNMYAFEILVGPYAVAHLRLTQEILSEGGNLPDGRLQVYLADTLESPFTTPPGALDLTHKPLVEERKRARRVKEKQNILVCIGNPPYDRQNIEHGDTITQRKGGWVRFGDQQEGAAKQKEQGVRPILEDFIEPVQEAGQGVHLKNLYNDYVYFWRWALWKLFEHQETGGIASFITASSYLAGPGFVGMREVMRRTFDELWIINLEGDNLGARKTENVFNIQTPVAIAVGYCKGKPRRDMPAKVHYAKLTGSREDKLGQLNAITQFATLEWKACPTGWHDRFLPQGGGDFFSWPALTDIFPWQHSGMQFKRRWPIGETQEVLSERWRQFLKLGKTQRAEAFSESRDRKISKTYSNNLPGSDLPCLVDLGAKSEVPEIKPYAYRSFDRQFMLFDTRLGDYLRPDLVASHSNAQLYIQSLLTKQIGTGPSGVVTELLMDLDAFCGRGAKDIIPLWRNSGTTQPNITAGVLDRLKLAYRTHIKAEDLFAYAYAVLASPHYVKMFWEELSTPGPRLPVSKSASLFDKASKLGCKLIWLHTFGNRMVPKGKRAGEVPQGNARCLKAIPQTEMAYPEEFSYSAASKEIQLGAGRFGPVAPEIWEFEISGLKVVQSWLAYRRRSGAGKRSSPLDEIRPPVWTAQLTDQFLEMLWVLEHTVALYPDLQRLLEEIVKGDCFLASDFPQPTAIEREAPQVLGQRQARDTKQEVMNFGAED